MAREVVRSQGLHPLEMSGTITPKLRRLCLGIVFFHFSLWTGLAQQPSASPAPAYAISVIPDHGDATYRIHEPITFSIAISHEGTPMADGTVDWSLTQDGGALVGNGAAILKDGRATVTGQMAVPGFLQCKVGFKIGNELIRGLGAAAVEPLQIRPSLPVPADFDAFWAAKKSQLRAMPINARITPISKTYPGIEVFDVQADAVGDKPMRGYYARPVGAKPKSLPAIITLEGAGVYATRLEPWLTGWARDGFISLELNAHGLPNSEPTFFYQALETGALKDYQLLGRTSRDTSYFLNMYLRALRGVDFLTSQPEWNGRVLVANGSSQGAAQAIFVAAEDPRVTFLAAAVPGMCDLSGTVAGRVAGWPHVPNGADGKPDPATLEASRYFDAMNFTTRIRVPAFFIAGFIDQTAPPTSVYAAYNNLPAQKEIYPAIRSPHRIEPEIMQEFRRRVLLQNK